MILIFLCSQSLMFNTGDLLESDVNHHISLWFISHADNLKTFWCHESVAIPVVCTIQQNAVMTYMCEF